MSKKDEPSPKVSDMTVLHLRKWTSSFNLSSSVGATEFYITPIIYEKLSMPVPYST